MDATETDSGSCILLRLQRPPLNQTKQDHHHGNHKKDVDETAQGVGRHQSKQPENDQYNCDSTKHDVLLCISVNAGTALPLRAWSSVRHNTQGAV